MLSPTDYMSRLEAPAMITSYDGETVYENPRIKGFIPLCFRKRLLRYIEAPNRDLILSETSQIGGCIVTLRMGKRLENALLVRDDSCLRWYFLRILAERPPITLPKNTHLWIAKAACQVEAAALSGIDCKLSDCFANAALSAFIDFKPTAHFMAYDLCRLVSMASFFLVFRDRFLFPIKETREMLLQSPMTAFFAAGEMIQNLLERKNAEWHFTSDNSHGILTDGRTRLCTGRFLSSPLPRTASPHGTISLLTMVTTASAVSAAEMALFAKQKH